MPPAVFQSFSVLVPALAVIVVSWLIKMVIIVTPYINLLNIIREIVAKPLVWAGGSYLGELPCAFSKYVL
ncbi:MAG: hypothetical protein NTX05_06715 [Fusobacteria bacterium]|nr:hypothetical protein [Fusobacteriota bacterium]